MATENGPTSRESEFVSGTHSIAWRLIKNQGSTKNPQRTRSLAIYSCLPFPAAETKSKFT